MKKVNCFGCGAKVIDRCDICDLWYCAECIVINTPNRVVCHIDYTAGRR